jgi:hypothetical protein
MAVLLIENCGTHCVFSAMQKLADHHCKMVPFSRHMTHILQPMDVVWARKCEGDPVGRMAGSGATALCPVHNEVGFSRSVGALPKNTMNSDKLNLPSTPAAGKFRYLHAGNGHKDHPTNGRPDERPLDRAPEEALVNK